MMDEVNGGVYRWKGPFCQRRTKLIVIFITRARVFFLHSIIYIYLPSGSVLSGYLYSRNVIPERFGGKCNTAFLYLFIPKLLTQQHYLQINEHAHITQLIIYWINIFKLNHIFLYPAYWFVGESGRKRTSSGEKEREREEGGREGEGKGERRAREGGRKSSVRWGEKAWKSEW